MDNLRNRTDEQLVTLYATGVNEAFNTLFERYKDRLYSYIYYTIRNTDIANDIFQETFVKAIVTIQQGRYKESGKFYAWLTRIAHNLIIDQFRLTKNENTISSDEVNLSPFDLNHLTESSRENKIIDEQNFSDICHLIDFLPENQREIVHMHIYKDLSFKEIAALKGISINTALGRMRYAILNMRRMANKQQLDPYTN